MTFPAARGPRVDMRTLSVDHARGRSSRNPGGSMTSLRGIGLVPILVLIAAVACQDSQGPIEPEDGGADLTASRGPGSGRTGAPEQIGLARAIPGFGGIFVGREGNPVVYLTDPSRLDAARGPLAAYLQRHGL